MVSHFVHARRRLARAQKHIDDYVVMSDSFVANNPPQLVIEENPNQPGRRLFKLAMSPLPEAAEDFAVDAIAGLRASLDYAAFASTVALGPPSAKKTHFPFGSDATNLESMRQRGSRDLHPEIFDLFASLEPYPCGKGTLLWSLNNLRNIAEHTAVVSVGIATGVAQVSVPDGIDPASVTIFENGWDREKNEVVMFEVDPPRPNLQYHFQAPLQITFPQGLGIERTPAGGFLQQMVGVIDGIITATEAETIRLS